MFQEDLLSGKHILITGGGTGLGKAMGQRIIELGAHVTICGRREEVLQNTADEFNAAHPESASWQACDIRDADAVNAMVDACWKERPLDALLNNAAGNFIARSETLSHRALDAVLSIVLHGTAYVTMACGKRWLEAKRPGNVLSILTTYAFTGSGYVLPSAMGKAGVLAMTRSLAAEWGGRGVRLNAIAPGPFPTEGAWKRLFPEGMAEKRMLSRIPLGRVGDHAELANLAVYLLADQSGYINGEIAQGGLEFQKDVIASRGNLGNDEGARKGLSVPTLYVAKSKALQDWGHGVGVTKYLYKVGVADDADATIAEMNETQFAGRGDWKLLKKTKTELDETAATERVARREQILDPDFYPQIRGAGGVFKVKLTNVENDMVVRAALASEHEQIKTGTVKEKDIVAYLLRRAEEDDAAGE